LNDGGFEMSLEEKAKKTKELVEDLFMFVITNKVFDETYIKFGTVRDEVKSKLAQFDQKIGQLELAKKKVNENEGVNYYQEQLILTEKGLSAMLVNWNELYLTKILPLLKTKVEHLNELVSSNMIQVNNSSSLNHDLPSNFDSKTLEEKFSDKAGDDAKSAFISKANR